MYKIFVITVTICVEKMIKCVRPKIAFLNWIQMMVAMVIAKMKNTVIYNMH